MKDQENFTSPLYIIERAIGTEIFKDEKVQKILTGCGESVIADTAKDIVEVEKKMREQLESSNSDTIAIDFYKQPTAVLLVLEKLKQEGHNIRLIGFDFDGWHLMRVEKDLGE